jgi:hypothetical protein
MKRSDAFHKLRAICQRLDEADPDTFPVVPLRAYLFGSALTAKPNPADLDVILVYDRPPHYDIDAEIQAMSYHLPRAHHRASTHLRRGMKMVQLYMVEFALDHWDQRGLLLFVHPLLIWQPDGNWQTALAQIEAHPLPVESALTPAARAANETYLQSLSHAELTAQLRQALIEIQSQQI